VTGRVVFDAEYTRPGSDDTQHAKGELELHEETSDHTVRLLVAGILTELFGEVVNLVGLVLQNVDKHC
jgi:hypothetical protein